MARRWRSNTAHAEAAWCNGFTVRSAAPRRSSHRLRRGRPGRRATERRARAGLRKRIPADVERTIDGNKHADSGVGTDVRLFAFGQTGENRVMYRAAFVQLGDAVKP